MNNVPQRFNHNAPQQLGNENFQGRSRDFLPFGRRALGIALWVSF